MSALVPSAFPSGADWRVVKAFQAADKDGNGVIDEEELQRILSSKNQSFSIQTVRLLMDVYSNTKARMIGPEDFTFLFNTLQKWRAFFDQFDRDRDGKINARELQEALHKHLGFEVTQKVLDLLFSKFSKPAGRTRAIEYDGFIECCLTAKGLTRGFKTAANNQTGLAAFNYDSFMLTVLPFLPGF